MQKDHKVLQEKRRAVPERSSVSCIICQAAYAPARQRGDLMKASPLALESAFMSMCHFCFRCRRPSCPECWDYIHGLCGACTQEAQLPFRTELPPLDGTLFAPVRQAQSMREQRVSSPLVCIRPGAYTPMQEPPIDRITTRPEPFYAQIQTDVGVAPILHSSQRKKTTRALNAQDPVTEVKTQPVREPAAKKIHIVERLLTFFLVFILLGVVALVVIAVLSPEANAAILALLHINIRTEIAYLLQLFQQLFS